VYQFTPPTTTYRAGTDSLWGRVKNNRGLAVVLYDDGRVITSQDAPSSSDAGVSAVWPGGRTYLLTDEQADVLTEAGYSANLTEVV
jgi:hypothetical protein